MATLFVFGCSLSYSTNWPKRLAEKFNLDLVKVAVPAGDNVTQCRRFIDLLLQDKINFDDVIIWEITYLDRMGFRLRPDHPFLENSKKVQRNLHSFEHNLFDSHKHLDYVAFNSEWYDTWYYVKNTTQTLSEIVFTLIMANQTVRNKCLIWFAQNNLFDENQDKTFCNLLDKNNILHLDYNTQSLMSWVYQNSLPLSPLDNMHPTEPVYQQFVETFIEPHIKKLIADQSLDK